MPVSVYKGYSSVGNNFGSTKISDTELIKRDLLNNFAIRKGEKLMNADFGTSLQDLIMDPLTEQTKNAVIQEINAVIENDPRVTPKSIVVDEYQFGLQIEMSLQYAITNEVETLLIRFNRADGSVI